MRVLAIDWGEKRIGLAAGESEFKSARPLQKLAATGSLERDAAAIRDVAVSEAADAIVVGIPVNPLGSDSMERICRTLVERLQSLDLLVFSVDESMSSAETNASLREMEMKSSARKKSIDSESAARILMRFFEWERASRGGGSTGE